MPNKLIFAGKRQDGIRMFSPFALLSAAHRMKTGFRLCNILQGESPFLYSSHYAPTRPLMRKK